MEKYIHGLEKDFSKYTKVTSVDVFSIDNFIKFGYVDLFKSILDNDSFDFKLAVKEP